MLDRLMKVFATRTADARPRAEPAPAPASRADLHVNVYATCVELPAADFAHHLDGARNRLDPDLAEHLEGFVDHVARHAGAPSAAAHAELVRHIRRTQWHASLAVHPDHGGGLARWAARINAILFMADGSVRDPQGRLLLARDGSCDPEAAVPHPAEAGARRARTLAALAARGLAPGVQPSLSPAASESQLRSPAQVARRAVALLAVTQRVASLRLGSPTALDDLQRRLPAACRQLTPRELAFLADDAPSEAERAAHAGAHEALAVLAWALLRAEPPTLPAVPCDAARIAGVALRFAAENRAPRLLRPAGEILDALDLHVCARASLRAVRVDGQGAPSATQVEVLRQRVRALEWLVRSGDLAWDDVDVPI